MMKEIIVKCKNCGFEQTHLRDPDNPGRVICSRCSAVIKRKPRVKVEPIWITNKYDTHCRKCKRKLGIGSNVSWTPGKKGVLCESCGNWTEYLRKMNDLAKVEQARREIEAEEEELRERGGRDYF